MYTTDIEAKYAELESLNRELRQVKLQQFIRQTGSKVTVLPPNAEDLSMYYLFITLTTYKCSIF